jgi:penicillin-binding protein 1A
MEHLKTFQKTFSDRWDWNDPRNTALFANAINNAIKSSKEYRKAGSDDARELVLIRMRRNQQFIDSVKMALTRIQVGFVALDPKSGQIRAMVGNSDVNFRYGLNHATQIQRQPGSTFKPFVYTVAIDNGYTPAYQISNEPLSVDDGTGKKWTPHNSGGETGGIYTLRRGLANSVNLVAIRTMLEIAPADEVIRYAHRMGITSVLRPVASLAIGTSEVVPLEITAAYGSFANEGIYAKPISILKVVDRDGRVLESNTTELREVLSKETAYIITSMLKSVITSGTGSITRSFFTAPAAGKTGTTQDYADAWFIGYTPDLVAGVWTGFDDRRITYTGSYGQGAQAAGPIWGRFMKYVYEDPSLKMVTRDFTMPENVVQEKICIESQCIAGPNCPNTVVEYINKRYMPGVCVKHGGGGSSPSKTEKNTIDY